MIAVEGVVKTYRQGPATVRALDGVSLRVPRGQLLAVMGPSGSGKSTLLQLLAGLDVPDAGRIAVDGRDLGGLSETELTRVRRRRIGMVFQFFNLLPTLSAEENVALPLLLDGQRLARVRPRVGHLLRRLGLWERRAHRPDALSGGEMQRVAIARALVIEPALLLADEPTGNLDSATGAEVLGLLRTVAAAADRTVVMVTHDARAAAWADRVVHLRDGRVAADEPLDRTGAAGA